MVAATNCSCDKLAQWFESRSQRTGQVPLKGLTTGSERVPTIVTHPPAEGAQQARRRIARVNPKPSAKLLAALETRKPPKNVGSKKKKNKEVSSPPPSSSPEAVASEEQAVFIEDVDLIDNYDFDGGADPEDDLKASSVCAQAHRTRIS